MFVKQDYSLRQALLKVFAVISVLSGSYYEVSGGELCNFWSAEEIAEGRALALAKHNFFRCMHLASPMYLDDEVTKVAQDYSERLALEMVKGGEFKHSSNGYGENLFSSSSKESPKKQMVSAVEAWYSEWEGYHSFKEQSGVTGHFTQVVWRKSIRLGMGIAFAANTKCGQSAEGALVITGNYDPAGNLNTQTAHELNVLSPDVIMEEEECQGAGGGYLAATYNLCPGLFSPEQLIEAQAAALVRHNFYRCINHVHALAVDHEVWSMAQAFSEIMPLAENGQKFRDPEYYSYGADDDFRDAFAIQNVSSPSAINAKEEMLKAVDSFYKGFTGPSWGKPDQSIDILWRDTKTVGMGISVVTKGQSCDRSEDMEVRVTAIYKPKPRFITPKKDRVLYSEGGMSDDDDKKVRQNCMQHVVVEKEKEMMEQVSKEYRKKSTGSITASAPFQGPHSPFKDLDDLPSTISPSSSRSDSSDETPCSIITFTFLLLISSSSFNLSSYKLN